MIARSLLAAALLMFSRVAAAQLSFDDLVAQARQHQQSGDFAAAATDYRAALKLRPQMPELWANLGFMENQMNRYDEAIQHFEHALRLRPQMFAPNLFIGLDELERSHPATAVRYLTRAESIERSDPQAPLALGRAYTALHELPEAARTYARAAALQPAENRALFAEGVALLEDVESTARTLSSTAPASAYARALLAKSYLQEGKTAQAAAILNELAQREPAFLKTQLPLLMQGSAVGQSAVKDAASPALAGMLNAVDGATASACDDTAARREANSAEKACEPWAVYDRVTRQAASPATLYWRIVSGQQLAAAALTKAAAIAPDAPQTHVLLGDIARQQQQSDAALTEYNKALALAPGDPAALLGATATYLLQAKPEQAMATAHTFLSQRPDDPEMNLLLAEALVSSRDFNGAQSALQKTAGVPSELQPRRHALLGKVYAETDQPAAAIAELKLGAASDEDGSVHYQLARLYRRAGDTAAANAAMTESKRLADERLRRASTAIGTPLHPATQLTR